MKTSGGTMKPGDTKIPVTKDSGINCRRLWYANRTPPSQKTARMRSALASRADEKVSAADLEIMSPFTKVPIANNPDQCWNDAEDGVGCEDCRPQLAKQNCQ